MSDNLKVCVITGGNKGIGLAITKKFLDTGYVVFVGARSSINIKNKNLHFIKTDIKEEDQIKNFINSVIKEYGKIDTLINNAGYSKWKKIENITSDDLNDIFQTNLFSVYFTIKHSLPYMNDTSSIININSIAGKRGSTNNSMYCGTKFGLTGITQSLAKELGERGIRVNGICPVLIETEGLVTALKEDDSPTTNVQNFLQEFTNTQTALKRLPILDDIANMCIFLSSDNSQSITGQNINVDCGVFPQ